MKYEFHVGDYVETKDGWIGYVDRVDSIDNSLDIVWTSGNAISGETVHADWELLCDELSRIGQYDFTKPENPKEIERLKEFERENIWNERSGGWLYAQHRKINELVDAVNELRKERT